MRRVHFRAFDVSKSLKISDWTAIGVFHGWGVEGGNTAMLVELDRIVYPDKEIDSKGVVQLVDLSMNQVWFVDK